MSIGSRVLFSSFGPMAVGRYNIVETQVIDNIYAEVNGERRVPVQGRLVDHEDDHHVACVNRRADTLVWVRRRELSGTWPNGKVIWSWKPAGNQTRKQGACGPPDTVSPFH